MAALGTTQCVRWLLILCLCLAGQWAAAQDGKISVGSDSRVVVSPSFVYLEDPTGQLTIREVQEPTVESRFLPVARGGKGTNFGNTNSIFWLRLQVQSAPDSPGNWLLEIANPPLDEIDLYSVGTDGRVTHQIGGDSKPFSQRSHPHRNHVLPVALEPGTSTMLYLRIASQGTVSAPTTLWQPDAMRQKDQQNYLIFGMYFGLLMGLLAYNSLLYFSVRDPSFLTYVLFVACVGVSQAANTGLGGQFLWPDSLWWNNNSINAGHAGTGIFAMWFARIFLASKEKLPRLDRWMQAQVVLWIATLALTLLLPYKAAAWLVTGLIPFGVVTVVLAGTLSVIQKHPGAQYFGLAWAALFIGVITQLLHNFGFLSSNAVTSNGLLLGSAVEMVLLSFALADRIKVARREKELALARASSEESRALVLQQSQERYRSVIEHVAEGMVVLLNNKIVFVNTRATEILEETKEGIEASRLMQSIHPDDRDSLVERVRSRIAGKAVSERCEIRLLLLNKPLKWLEVGDNMVPWDGGQGLLMFFLDVTQRHIAEAETRKALERQQELNALRSRFVAMTSHEFRTPLATILSSQDLLQHYSERLPAAERKEVLESIAAGVHRMTSMLDRVLLLGKAEAHMLEFKPQDLDLKVLCETLVLEAQQQHPESPCTVVLEFLTEHSHGAYDEKLLRHIFGNLLSNAMKYSPNGGVVRFKVSQIAQGPLEFDVSDQGIGIPLDEIDDLFESFHRASNVGTIAGTGLGLSIVKQSVELHGGSIAVRCPPGGGSIFTVRL